MGSNHTNTLRMRLWQVVIIVCIGCGNLPALADSSAVPLQASKYPATAPAILRGVEKFARVSDNLYRGAQPTAEGFAELKRMGIKTVVSLRSWHNDADLLKGSGLQYVRIECNAWDPRNEDVIAFLKVVSDPQNQPVFVHCAQGVDRTGMMVAAYRIVEQGWSAQDAVRELQDFGFHTIWGSIKQHVEHFDADFFNARLKIAKAIKIAQIN